VVFLLHAAAYAEECIFRNTWLVLLTFVFSNEHYYNPHHSCQGNNKISCKEKLFIVKLTLGATLRISSVLAVHFGSCITLHDYDVILLLYLFFQLFLCMLWVNATLGSISAAICWGIIVIITVTNFSAP